MNYEKIYKSYVRSVFSDECHSIIRTVMYIQRKYADMPQEFKSANRALDDETKNRIIQSILWEDEVATRYKMLRV